MKNTKRVLAFLVGAAMMLPMASAVAGLLTAMVAPLSEPTHLPSM